MENLTQSEVQLPRRLMEGTTIDKDRAETTLKHADPSGLPVDILECWKCGSTFDKFRAGRVKEEWNVITAQTEA